MLLSVIILGMVAEKAPARPVVDQARLDRMSDACHTPRAWLRHAKRNEVTFKASLDAPLSDVECVMKEILDSHLPIELGLIGNAPITEEK